MSSYSTIPARGIVIGVSCAVASILVLILVLALLFHFAPISELYLSAAAVAAVIVSTFIGGFSGARSAGSRGLVHGIIVGLVFFLLVVIATLVFTPDHISPLGFLKDLLVCIIPGICGGILGVSS